MALKRKELETCASFLQWENKNKNLRGDADAPPGFGVITVASSSSPSSPRYWRHFLHYQRQLSLMCPSSSSSLHLTTELGYQDSCQLSSPTFDNQEYEETYLGLRRREITLVYKNYADTEFGHLVLKQRRLIIDWMVDVSWVRYETTFLAVSLLDSFLSRGSFRCSRYLQLLGIACLMLASRIEENQNENEMVEQSAFHVEGNTYYVSEIIGMEWLVQKVLNFRCSLPTIYNFLCVYLKAVNAEAQLERTATKLALTSLLDHGRLGYSPSTVAAALLILADPQSSCRHKLPVTGDVQSCIKSLGKWLEDYNNSDSSSH